MPDKRKIYRVNCPACREVNNLEEQDLGRRLNCGACGNGFVFGKEIADELAADRKAEAARRRQSIKEQQQIERDRENERREQERLSAKRRHESAKPDQPPLSAVEVLDLAPASAIENRKSRRWIAIVSVVILISGVAAASPYLYSRLRPQPAVPVTLTDSEYKKSVLSMCEKMRILFANSAKGVTIIQFNEKLAPIREEYFVFVAKSSAADRARPSYAALSTAIDRLQTLEASLKELIFAEESEKNAKNDAWEINGTLAMMAYNSVETAIASEP